MSKAHKLPDVLGPGLDVVFVGTAAGTRSAREGVYYAHPGNRFWRTVKKLALLPEDFAPGDFAQAPRHGIGFTDMCKLRAGSDAQAFMERVHDVLVCRRQDLDALLPSDLALPSWTPVGPGTFGRFMEIRVFDFWVHERDISTPLGRPTDDTNVAAKIALAEVEGSLGYIVGKKIGLPDGRSIVFHLSGPLARDIAVVVDGRAAVVDGVTRADVEIWTDPLTLIQLASGRIDPQGPIDSGAIRWSGDDEFGERAARNLRFTM